MSFRSFTYRQLVKIRSRITPDDELKIVLKNNFHEHKIIKQKDGYFIPEASILLPRNKYTFIYKHLSLFIKLRKELNGKYFLEAGKLIFAFNGIKINICSESELIVIEEIFVRQCYNFLFKTQKPIVVVDVGMNTGIASLFFAQKPEVINVFGFEPFKATFKKATDNFDLNPAFGKKITASMTGLGLSDEIVKSYYDSKNDSLNSSNKITTGSTVEEIEIQNAKKAIESIADEHKHHSIILKIDCEGAEYDIFKSAFTEKIDLSIEMIILEWHEQGPEKLIRILEDNQFKIISTIIETGKSGLIYAIR